MAYGSGLARRLLSLLSLLSHAAYTRMLWHESIFLEDDPEEAYKNRIKRGWQPVASVESIACRWPDYHNHCVGKHPMLRSSEGLRLADDYCVMLKNWRCGISSRYLSGREQMCVLGSAFHQMFAQGESREDEPGWLRPAPKGRERCNRRRKD